MDLLIVGPRGNARSSCVPVIEATPGIEHLGYLSLISAAGHVLCRNRPLLPEPAESSRPREALQAGVLPIVSRGTGAWRDRLALMEFFFVDRPSSTIWPGRSMRWSPCRPSRRPVALRPSAPSPDAIPTLRSAAGGRPGCQVTMTNRRLHKFVDGCAGAMAIAARAAGEGMAADRISFVDTQKGF